MHPLQKGAIPPERTSRTNTSKPFADASKMKAILGFVLLLLLTLLSSLDFRHDGLIRESARSLFAGGLFTDSFQPIPELDSPNERDASEDLAAVGFDNYSLILKGQRVFIHSGEFHTFRLPVPSLWPDILDKFRAAGFNAISLYTHMGLINPSRGVLDFDGYRSLQTLFDAAKKAGIWVVVRPGPYINAETTAGGIAHWATSEVKGELKTNASDWRDAWMGYIEGIIQAVNGSQITNGGPVIAIQIDNEYNQEQGAEYFAQLEAVYRDPRHGIQVPLTYNDPGMGRNFINGTGAVDLYGMDAYPQRFDCSNPSVWQPVPPQYHEYHEQVNPSQPWYIPEFQGGAFDPWGPKAPGYAACAELTGAEFESVFYRHLWASNAKMINYYMLYGGTSWGGLPFHGVYTSYDYGAAISESRMLTPKYTELKFQGMFLRSSPEFIATDWIGDTAGSLTTGAVVPIGSTRDAGYLTHLRNSETHAGFWILRQNDSTLTAASSYKLNVTLSDGSKLQVPSVASSVSLTGRQSKVIVTDYLFGRSRVLYSTAQVFFAGVIDDRDVIFLYGDTEQEHELALRLTGTPNKLDFHASIQTNSISTQTSGRVTVFTVLEGFEGFIPLYDSDTQLVLIADSATAAKFWAPIVTSSSESSVPDDPFANYWSIGTNESILIGGPYLVRSASLKSIPGGTRLALKGDLNVTADGVMLNLVIPKSVRSLTWNGEEVYAARIYLTGTSTSIITVPLGKTDVSAIDLKRKLSVPDLEQLEWKYRDSLPEIDASFDDSNWTVADHRKTNIPWPMYYGDGRILYGCDYGFCENVVIWRGHFTASGAEKSVNLSINGGEAFAASVWLNDRFLATSFGNSSNNQNIIEETDEEFVLPKEALLISQDNVITVVQDNMGLNETDNTNNDPKSPRGIRGFQLNSGNFTEWKVQGKVGGYLNFPDRYRGVLNEGGFFGERKGWHLPGFNTNSWGTRNLSLGLPDGRAGVGFFITTFNLSIPSAYDAPMSFNFEEPLGQPYRAYLFVNGWMMGKRVANLGPQAKFPVPEGILDYRGSNTVAVAVWSMTPNVEITPRLQLVVNGLFEGGVDVQINNPVWSSQGRE